MKALVYSSPVRLCLYGKPKYAKGLQPVGGNDKKNHNIYPCNLSRRNVLEYKNKTGTQRLSMLGEQLGKTTFIYMVNNNVISLVLLHPYRNRLFIYTALFLYQLWFRENLPGPFEHEDYITPVNPDIRPIFSP